MKSYLIIFSVLAFASGCSLRENNTPEYYIQNANDALSNNDKKQFIYGILNALKFDDGGIKVQELFFGNKTGKHWYYDYLEKGIEELTSPSSAAFTQGELNTAKKYNLFSTSETESLYKKFDNAIVNGNLTGKVPFVLSDNINAFPLLNNKLHQDIILDRTINFIQQNKKIYRGIYSLMNYVKKVGKDSEEGKRIESLLPTLHISQEDLQIVSEYYPNFTSQRKVELTNYISIEAKNIDRIMLEDIKEAIALQVQNVEWVEKNKAGSIVLVIEKIRNEERIQPEKTQTIIYARNEVNLMDALLLMPQNSSYIYDMVSGGAEIDYGFSISSIYKEKNNENLIRGKVGGQYIKCQNIRIQNVFGGVSAANFMANSDMQEKCNKKTDIAIDNLRINVLKKIATEVYNIVENYKK